MKSGAMVFGRANGHILSYKAASVDDLVTGAKRSMSRCAAEAGERANGIRPSGLFPVSTVF